MIPIKDTEQVELSASAVDAKGNPAPVEDATWTSSDETVVAVTVSTDDPLKATAKAVGALGSARVTVSGDAVIGEGTETISGFIDVEVKAGQATSFAVAAGTPTPQA